jgi:hypothetical protein
MVEPTNLLPSAQWVYLRWVNHRYIGCHRQPFQFRATLLQIPVRLTGINGREMDSLYGLEVDPIAILLELR